MKNKLELNSSNLINMFGSRSNIFSQIFHHLIHLGQKNKEDYKKWMEISIKIYGQTYLKENINRKIANFYKIDDGVTISLLLFTLQTYYSILLKIFGVELAFRKIKSNSYFKEIIELKENSNLIKHLTLMESNELFKQLKITNFLVDESFSWYLSHVTPTIEKILLKLINLVTKFDFEFVNFKGDLFQSLYQDLIHQKVRQKIGEFYTPNWLAQFLIKEIGMKNHFQQKILDPSCGSGVFLINLISIFKKIGKENKSANSEILNNILNKIHGFDLNPVAVFTSKLNYFINIIDLLSDEIQENLEIPIYQKDSIKYQDKNYDLIIGNPPWVNWEQLPKDYRDSLIIECKNFGLFSLKGFESRLGGGRKDFSIIFLYFCVNNYLKLGGTLGFIITQTIFKTKGAGEGFRGFNLQNENIPLKVKIVHDLVQIRPFYS
ncbi:MAG: N-6 DNA methylase, partial [Candidatus Helarchaeota archaeon]